MGNRNFTFTMNVEVTDPRRILAAARAKLKGDIPANELRNMNLRQALGYLLDPGNSPAGCIIHDSNTEEHVV